MGYKILDVKEDIKDNISDWMMCEYCNEYDIEEMNQAEAQELVDSINAIVDKHFERIER
jgi:hypothetical protein